ncbi:MAG: FliM/FliN family flagellar motor switch protein [Phycisphaerales bacterium]|nr:FliM/FliN family flagellar motor switch protein [Phycisphaerales bacterium]|tara:strand:+ start:3062 stop:3310 length:249 start_codon:yes stop_codon:yes gene_type:complete
MSSPKNASEQLPIPITVRIASKSTALQEITHLQPGSIIELPKRPDEDLDIMVNASVIAKGRAVKVGENFGVEITSYRGLDQG